MSENHRMFIHDEMVFGLNRSKSAAGLKLKSLEWAIITQVNGKKTVAEIGEALALTPAETERYFTHLHELGLLEVVGNPVQQTPVSRDLIDELQYQLTYVIGPIADIILEDCLSDLKRKRENLDQRHLAILIEWVSQEIVQPEKRLEFQKKMLRYLLKEAENPVEQT